MRKDYTFSRRQGCFIKKQKREAVDYEQFATKSWQLILSFFCWWPDVMEDICEGSRCEYHNSLMGRVTKRYMARCQESFTYATRGYGKTSDVMSSKCDKGLLWPGEITGYYAPTESQAAPIASKAFAGYARNYPILAQHWQKNADAREHFAISTIRGSKFIMDIERGLDTSGLVAEECGQEDRYPFNFNDFNQVAVGTNRLQYYVDGKPSSAHIDGQIHYITSASRKENPAFATYMEIRKEMLRGGNAFGVCIPWQVPVLCRMKPFYYYQKLRKKLTAEQFMRECESKCTGSVDNPIVKDSVLNESRKVMLMEDKHCGKKDVLYILGYDVSSRDHANNALSAMAVLKCERQYDTTKWDHYKKSLVYVMDMRPPKSARAHAMFIKRRWYDYSIRGGQNTVIVIDARAYGQSVVEHLHEDLGDGFPPFCTMNNDETYAELVKPGALPVIYPLQATGNSGRDPNSAMLDYIEREYENGNLFMLTPSILDGTAKYKLAHGITDDRQDVKIQLPYLKTNELCRQIMNLQKKYVTTGWIEAAVSKYIPKDMWSATLYANRLAQRLEKEVLYAQNRSECQWENAAAAYNDGHRRPAHDSGLTIKGRSVRRLGRGAIKK